MQLRPQDDVKQQVQQYAEATRAAAGSDTFPQANTNVSACEGAAGELSDPDSVYYIQGIYQASVPADQQLEALRKTRQAWEDTGYTITEDRTFPDGQRGQVAAKSGDGFSFSLSSGDAPAMLLLIGSPCYRTPGS
ncbi:hypothetical protein GCM10025331_51340 [Actinoplanes utahensis]|uniref:Lipoprotein n=1 Tax=Actinoplanes utahensis TaxID=1869 RepID=A0A0A6URX1_ACTUT|nr:hypothetical protein MB27_12255 [Actinoplanes utahensis]GIF33576.1 hypothetical protein Aut01nite_65620 [Actinoplanes utahensis]